ncbi:MAG: amidohydrolase family protein, partial [Gammaproteobacteria bacterium]
NLDWVCSDHACCKHEMKVDGKNPGDIFLAKSGFGGTEYMLSALASEGKKRGLSYNRMAELTSLNPARRFGLHNKGDFQEGLDADVVLLDPNETWTVRAEESESQQGHTPFEGQELGARVKTTFLRGNCIFDNNEVIGEPGGRFMRRPY